VPEKLTFLRLSELVMENVKRPLTPREIWDLSEEIRNSQNFQTGGKTPWATIGAQLYVDVRDHKEKSKFYHYSKRPSRFYLSKYRDRLAGDLVDAPAEVSNFDERDLHPLLVKFIDANEHFHAKARTIHHEQSVKRARGYDEWLHPDIVGVYYPYSDFDPKVIEVRRELPPSEVKSSSATSRCGRDMP